jgi:transposase
MGKHGYEKRLEAVLAVTERGLTYRKAADIIGAGTEAVKRWVASYREHGTQGLKPCGSGYGKYEASFKQSVIEYMHKNYLSIRQTAVHFAIAYHSTVRTWERIYNEQGVAALAQNRRGRPKMLSEKEVPEGDSSIKLVKGQLISEDLIAEFQRLRMENAYLKKLHTLVQERRKKENGK